MSFISEFRFTLEEVFNIWGQEFPAHNFLHGKLILFDANEDYINFLVPYALHLFHNKTESEKFTRKFIGILLSINDTEYFAPLSSFKEKHRKMKNSLDLIKIENIAVINLNCMFPLPEKCRKYVEINKIADPQYKALLQIEYRFIRSNQDKIRKNAQELYKQVTENPNTKLAKRCNNFKNLEEVSKKFKLPS